MAGKKSDAADLLSELLKSVPNIPLSPMELAFRKAIDSKKRETERLSLEPQDYIEEILHWVKEYKAVAVAPYSWYNITFYGANALIKIKRSICNYRFVMEEDLINFLSRYCPAYTTYLIKEIEWNDTILKLYEIRID